VQQAVSLTLHLSPVALFRVALFRIVLFRIAPFFTTDFAAPAFAGSATIALAMDAGALAILGHIADITIPTGGGIQALRMMKITNAIVAWRMR
jgi:hypothetical protein